MSVLIANKHYDFNGLKELLEVTDGSLASHIKALEKEGYITITKSFIGKKTNTQYAASAKGRAAFKNHMEALESLVREQKTGPRK